MTKRPPPFPLPPTPAHLDNPPGKTPIIEYYPNRVVPPTTACKHHPHGCEVCGTTDQRDALQEFGVHDATISAIRHGRNWSKTL